MNDGRGGAPEPAMDAEEVLRRAEAEHMPPPRVEAVGRLVGEVVTARACLVTGALMFGVHLGGATGLSPPGWWFALWAVLLGCSGSPTRATASPEIRAEAARRLEGGRVVDVLLRVSAFVALAVIYESGGVGPPPETGGFWVATKALFGLATLVATMSTPYADPGLGVDLRQHTARRRRRAAAGFLLVFFTVVFSYRRPLGRYFFGVDVGPTWASPDPEPEPAPPRAR